MQANVMGRFFEEFVEGEQIEHCFSKTIFESDNNLFSLITMNAHPVHTNADYASKQQHGQVLVVGTLVLSLVVGLTVTDISGKAVANLDYEKVEHLAPVFVGDTLYARSTVLSCRESKKKNDRGIIYIETVGYNQNGVEVIRLRRHVLVKKSNFVEEK
ncbi:MAG: MaoC family dehydratase [Lachnospiraceae bacterium]|nr:MaoC family dehydratase [Lachnospiraceae bacterium]